MHMLSEHGSVTKKAVSGEQATCGLIRGWGSGCLYLFALLGSLGINCQGLGHVGWAADDQCLERKLGCGTWRDPTSAPFFEAVDVGLGFFPFQTSRCGRKLEGREGLGAM
jgi:hypothetical protein